MSTASDDWSEHSDASPAHRRLTTSARLIRINNGADKIDSERVDLASRADGATGRLLADMRVTLVADPAHVQRNTQRKAIRTTSNPVAARYVTTWAINATDLTLHLAGVRYVECLLPSSGPHWFSGQISCDYYAQSVCFTVLGWWSWWHHIMTVTITVIMMTATSYNVRVIICYFTAVYLYCLLIRYCFYHSLVNKDFHNDVR